MPEKDFNITNEIDVQDTLTKLFAFQNFINQKTNSYSFKQWEALKNSYIKHILLDGGDLQSSNIQPLKKFQALINCVKSDGFVQASTGDPGYEEFFNYFGIDSDVVEKIVQTNKIPSSSIISDWIAGTNLQKQLKDYLFMKTKELKKLEQLNG